MAIETMRDLKEYAGGELDKVVANYEWHPNDRNGKPFGINIRLKVLQGSNSKFVAIPSHMVQKQGQASPYMSLEEKDEVEEAVKDCIRGFKAFIGTVEDTEWPLNENY